MPEPLVSIKGLRKTFPVSCGLLRRRTVGAIAAVDGVDLDLTRNDTLALVGESGCGKSTTGRLILRLLDPTEGSIWFDGKEIATARGRELRALRRRFQMIFQDPYGSLNPRMTIVDLVADPLRFAGTPRRERTEKAVEMMAAAGLGAQFRTRYPHELSGGQRQRVGIARALVLDPDLVVADEPVSALDVSIQAQVINLMQDLQERLDLTYLFISHDLGIVHHIADRVAVMYLGRIVELAERDTLFASPAHPYTRALIDAIPAKRPHLRKRRPLLEGDLATTAGAGGGCRFAPRCPFVAERCRVEDPPLRPLASGHKAACHFAEEIVALPQGAAGPLERMSR